MVVFALISIYILFTFFVYIAVKFLHRYFFIGETWNT